MSFTAKDVMSLRHRTGLGMMECKEALAETGGDQDAAVELLRKKLKGKMDERADRAASQGTLAIVRAPDASAAALIELNTETDFVARGDAFVGAAEKIAGLALQGPDGPVNADAAIAEITDEIRITTKENASFARGVKLSGGRVGTYLHHNRQVGALVQADGEIDDELLTGLCQHVVAHVPTPIAVDEAGLPSSLIEKHRADFAAEAEASGKPAEIASKMAMGKLRKWIDENTLIGQIYVKDPAGKATIASILPKGAKIRAFVRMQVGIQ